MEKIVSRRLRFLVTEHYTNRQPSIIPREQFGFKVDHVPCRWSHGHNRDSIQRNHGQKLCQRRVEEIRTPISSFFGCQWRL